MKTVTVAAVGVVGLLMAALLWAWVQRIRSSPTPTSSAGIADVTVFSSPAEKVPEPKAEAIGPAELSPEIKPGFARAEMAMQSKEWSRAQALVEDLLADPAAKLYDRFALNNIKWQVMLQQEGANFAEAFVALDRANEIVNRVPAYAKQAERERLLQLGGQLAYQVGRDKPSAERFAFLEKATIYQEQFMRVAARPRPADAKYTVAILNEFYDAPLRPRNAGREKELREEIDAAMKLLPPTK